MKGWITAVLGCALLTAAVVIASSATDRTDELEEIGTRTDGIVVDISSGFRSEGHIDVGFTAAGEEQLRQINLNSDSPRYRVGDEVTVIYDPDNLSNLRTGALEAPQTARGERGVGPRGCDRSGPSGHPGVGGAV